MKKHVFVYGTLKKGRGNHGILGTSAMLGEAITNEKFYVTSVGFPYMIPEAESKGYTALPVMGEVYEVNDPKVMQSLDWLEGIAHNHYRHYETEVCLKETGEVVTVTAYVPYDGEEASGISHVCPVTEYQNKTVYNF